MEPAEHQRLQQQVDQLTTLGARLLEGRAAQADLPASPPRASVSIPVAMPDKYDGNTDHCQAFLMQCRLYIEEHPEHFTEETARQAFKGIFDHPAVGRSLGERLFDIKQGPQTVAEFTLEFRTIAAGLRWPEDCRHIIYHRALNLEVQDELTSCGSTPPFEEFIGLSVMLDNKHNYNVGDRELLTIKLALEDWRHWLKGAHHPFHVFTDHRNLDYLQVLLGLPLNALSLWIIVCRHRLRAANTVIMANLAVSDLLLILSLPLRIVLHIKPSKILMKTPCQLMTYLFRANILSSSFFITFISVDRMLALVYPLRSRVVRSPRTSGIACGAVWLLAMTYSISHVFKWESFYTCIPMINRCNMGDFNKTKRDEFSTPFFALILSVCLPLMFIVNVISTARVVWSLNNRQMDLAGYSVKRVMLISLVNVLIFALFLPFIVMLLWNLGMECP
ncbi:lysophosphatidic acid receptor 5-like [Brienomyrus brachyistius]|uniref:lysophosphatidic acid receptor 5-like n=1 Tax=Brienomyrus brachyistius TaxID=42636 RepID=UPI0020B2154E|nr:lysophosphatidic acid receptor 5-like [Brienomyrus brachyistius]